MSESKPVIRWADVGPLFGSAMPNGSCNAVEDEGDGVCGYPRRPDLTCTAGHSAPPTDSPPVAHGAGAGEGCDCTELCSMGPTCPGGMLAGLPDNGSNERAVQWFACAECGWRDCTDATHSQLPARWVRTPDGSVRCFACVRGDR